MPDILIPGPAGQIEACLTKPGSPGGKGAVLCHPHPQFGGSMNDMVLASLEAALLDAGVISVRFNFRGVGGSEGSYDDGTGEVEDVVSVVNWLRQEQGCTEVLLAGYSFGGAIALSAQELLGCDRMVLVAPAVGMFGTSEPPKVPAMIVLAENDQFVNAGDIENWLDGNGIEVRKLEGADHFFFGQHELVTELTAGFLETSWN